MSQFQAQIPHPLTHDTPGLLTASGVTTPPIWVLLGVFIGESRLKGAAMQVQFDDIAGGECLLWQVGEKEFVDYTRTRDANGTFLFARRMCRHHHTAAHAPGPDRYLRAIVEATHHSAFRALLELIGRQVQTCLGLWMIEDRVLFAARHKSEPGQIGEHRSRAVLAIESEQSALL
jgi:hypothetical protein